VTDESYAKALNLLVHFATNGDCASYMADANIKDKPVRNIVNGMRIFNGVNCAQWCMYFI
jgi:hypothetical protein